MRWPLLSSIRRPGRGVPVAAALGLLHGVSEPRQKPGAAAELCVKGRAGFGVRGR